MKLIISIAIAILVSNNIYGQQDTDGDGIPDNVELKLFNKEESPTCFHPYISDLPFININFSGLVRIGVEKKVSSDLKYTTELKTSFSNAESESEKNKHYTSKTFQNRTESKMKFGFKDIIGSMTPTLGMEITNSTSFEYSNGFAYTNESWKEWKKGYEETKKTMETKNVSFGADDGYITTSITLFNPSNNFISISNIKFSFYEYDVFTGIIDDIPFEQLKTVYFEDNETAQSSTRILAPGLNGPFRIHIPKINTSSILSILKNNKYLVFKLEKDYELSFRLMSDDRTEEEYKFSKQRQSIERKTFKLRLIDEEKDASFYIAKKDSNNQYLTLKIALEILFPQGVSYEKIPNSEGTEIDYIYSIGDKVSNLNINKKYNEYDNDDLKRGYWFKIFNENGAFKGDLNEKIKAPNISVSLFYIKGAALFDKKVKKDQLVFIKNTEFLETRNEITDFHPQQEDSIVLEIKPRVERLETNVSKRRLLDAKCFQYGLLYRTVEIAGFYQQPVSVFDQIFLINNYFGIGINSLSYRVEFNRFSLSDKNLEKGIYTYSYIVKKHELVFNNPISIYYNQNDFEVNPVSIYQGFINAPMSLEDYSRPCSGSNGINIEPSYDNYVQELIKSQIKAVVIYPRIKTEVIIRIFRAKK